MVLFGSFIGDRGDFKILIILMMSMLRSEDSLTNTFEKQALQEIP